MLSDVIYHIPGSTSPVAVVMVRPGLLEILENIHFAQGLATLLPKEIIAVILVTTKDKAWELIRVRKDNCFHCIIAT